MPWTNTTLLKLWINFEAIYKILETEFLLLYIEGYAICIKELMSNFELSLLFLGFKQILIKLFLVRLVLMFKADPLSDLFI